MMPAHPFRIPAALAMSRARRRGQSAMEFAITWSTLLFPLLAMIVFTSQLLWVWHSVTEFTRAGAAYAATHCYQASGANVTSWMRSNVPGMVDADQFRDGAAEINVTFFQRNAETGALEEFTCDGAECSRECVPDVVRVGIANYQFTAFLSYLGLPPVSLPNFSATVAVESAGCNPDSEACLP